MIHLKYAFRITHIYNIPHILQYGIVRTNSVNRNDKYVNIGDIQVISLRKDRSVNGIKISDCVPFYFGPRSPMLYVIQHGYNGVMKQNPSDIVYCVIRLCDLIQDNIDCIFTDGHALDALSNCYDADRLSEIDTIINYDDVYARQWASETDLDLKRRKEAELLIKNDLPAKYIRGFVVYNNEAKEKLNSFGIADHLIVINPNYYF